MQLVNIQIIQVQINNNPITKKWLINNYNNLNLQTDLNHNHNHNNNNLQVIIEYLAKIIFNKKCLLIIMKLILKIKTIVNKINNSNLE
jgi:hypothetical protein